MISFVIPAHNEEALVGATIASVQRAGRALGRPFEVVVVDDSSTDATGEVARAAGATVVEVSVRQISKSRNAGVVAARGEYLVFVDADTVVTDEVVGAASAALEAGAVGGGAAVRFDEPVPRYSKWLLRVGLWINRRLRVAAGCFVFCRRDAFEQVGGFDPELFAGEEIVFTRAIGKLGKFVSLRQHVVTSGRKLRTYSGFRILGELGKLVFLGRRRVKKREGLDLWYGPRRPDPH